MAIIETLADLFAAGGHWVAQRLRSTGRGFAAFVGRMRERHGSELAATRATMGEFWRATGQAEAAASLVASGVTPPITAIPVMPIESSTGRFVSQGIVTLIDRELGEPGKPLTSSLPWQQQSESIPTIDQIRSRIDQSVQQEGVGSREYNNRSRRKRERAEYIRQRQGPTEYDIAPYFIWRTS